MSIAVSWHAAVCLLALAVGLAPVEHLLSRSLGSLIENSVLRGANAVDQRNGATSSRLIERVHGLPMTFQASDGETDAQVDFTARGRGYAVFLTAHEAVVLLTGPARSTPTNSDARSNSARLHVRLIGALAQPRAVGLQGLPGTVNDLLGDDPARWRTSIATYGGVGYREIYSGIDLAYGGDQRQLESRFVVRPGADPASIVLTFEGAEKIDVDREGNLRLQMDGGVILQRKPVIYQDVNGARQRIAGAYVLKGGHEVGISVANYDRSASLVINPVLFYSTYLGGTGSEEGGGIAVDADGYVYVTGRTPSIDFPASAGAFQPALSGVEDVFVTKLDPAGSAFLYSTYLGGTGIDTGQGIAVDVAGNAYLSGETASSDFPTTPGALQTIWPGRGGNTFVPFVAKLNPTGSALVYSTYLSGSTDGQAPSIAVDSAGNAYVTGQTTSSDFPTTVGAFQRTVKGQSDAFVAKLNATGSALVYSTLLGGGSTEHGRDIAIDGAGYAYVTGRTSSSDFPTTAGAFQTTKRSTTSAHAAWVTKLNPTGTALAYSTYVAGTGSDRGVAIAIDTQSTPSAYISGRTSSTDFPTTAGAFQTTSAGARDAFVAKLNPAGSALVFSTYLGGAADDESTGISVGADGSAYVSGETASSNFPTTAGAIQATLRGLTDSFVTRVDPSGSALAYSTYLGGSADDSSTGIAVDALGSAYVTGVTTSTDFPTTAGAFDTTFTGVEDAFVARIAEFGQPAKLTLAPNAATGPLNTQQCVTATVQDATGRAVPGVTVRFSVAGANSTNGSVRTDGGGQATFCYTGTRAGDDTITSSADTNKNGAQDGAEPSNTATKRWVVP